MLLLLLHAVTAVVPTSSGVQVVVASLTGCMSSLLLMHSGEHYGRQWVLSLTVRHSTSGGTSTMALAPPKDFSDAGHGLGIAQRFLGLL